ncbi:MAG: histidine kinase, partial [Bacteroidetes bacterium SW_10_40_5]
RAELNFLKAQVNPHFLFNAFNSLYALSLKEDKRLPDAILKLSDLMRYVLDYSQEETALLEEEVELIHTYLEVQGLRLAKDFDLQFSKTGDISRKKIIPLVLLPIVENCFKHSDLSGDGFIHLDLSVDNEYLNFSAKNKVEESKVNNAHATGLANLEKRLRLNYGEDFQLTTERSHFVYCSYLKILVYAY